MRRRRPIIRAAQGLSRTAVSLFLLPLLVPLVVGCAGENGDGPGEASVPESATLLIRGGWLFDATGDERIPNPGILVADSVMLQVGVDADASLPPDLEVVELTGQETVMPGIFDLHAHYAVDLLGQGRIDDTSVYPVVFLAGGVTSTFPAGEVNPYQMRELRLRIESGEQLGPRLYNSGPYFGTWRQGWSQEITADSIRAEVEYWVGRGAHAFKAKGISAPHLEALLQAAHAHGATVTGHLDSGFRNSVNPRDAIHMGIDRVEHFVGGDAMPDDRSAYESLVEMTPDTPGFREAVQLYVETGTFFNATLTAYGYFGAQEPEVFEYFRPEMDLLTPYAREEVEARLPRPVNDRFERIYRVKHDLLRTFYEEGGGHLITLGTDHPSWGQFFSGFGATREMHAMVRAGLPPSAVLRIATINGARALGVDDRLGTVEEGKLADLVILPGDPLEDIRHTRLPRLVVKGGRVHDPEALLDDAWGRLGPSGPEEAGRW
jgi:imidazolonepropionase-like amidohydrolase